ncbi:MmcB family DNA repair protein [Thioclava sp. GXIMD4216]|uniref:MmcB family DNA repair protein n=1 Tax=Thioclava litoralis TaxID=3076557 RepID=A0ABZ1DXF1_9RHOB|nr:MmcB family DNA repair protein [Thioclava sp. FTW29]
MSDSRSLSDMQPGQVLARGVARALADLGLASVLEMPLRPRLRADVMGLTRKGEIWIVECKSSRADFTSDRKWQGYLDWCDRYFWAVDATFPLELLPEDTGLFIADGYGAEMLRDAPEARLAPARRKALTLDFARVAAARLQGFRDPSLPVLPEAAR